MKLTRTIRSLFLALGLLLGGTAVTGAAVAGITAAEAAFDTAPEADAISLFCYGQSWRYRQYNPTTSYASYSTDQGVNDAAGRVRDRVSVSNCPWMGDPGSSNAAYGWKLIGTCRNIFGGAIHSYPTATGPYGPSGSGSVTCPTLTYLSAAVLVLNN